MEQKGYRHGAPITPRAPEDAAEPPVYSGQVVNLQVCPETVLAQTLLT